MSDSSARLDVYTDVNVVPEHENSELKKAISDLEGETVQLKKKQKLLDDKRRELLNNITNLKGSIRVFCRVRPILQANKMKVRELVETELGKMVIRLSGGAKEFGFDKVFPQEATQEDVFTEVEPILRSAVDGHNVCILAYGQTGTGKTFTMDGIDDQPGIVLRALEKLFDFASIDKTSTLTFSISMLEVYMGNLRDLLVAKPVRAMHETAIRCNLNIQTDQKGFIEIEGLAEVQIPDLTKAKWWYNRGRRARSTSWTTVNETSSRSHCLTRISIVRQCDHDGEVESSKLWMVDLGGSERLLKTGATGQTLDEGRAINLSLSALGDVIAALRRKKGHVPYRNSKLTQILKDSLGHDSKVLMLVHVSPCEQDLAETLCSLSFAKRARGVEFNRDMSEDLKKQREKKLIDLEETLKETEEESRKVETQLTKAEFLLCESKKLLPASPCLPLDDQTEPITPKNEKQMLKSPRVPARSPKAATAPPSVLPRFMTSTVASRQRQSASEQQITKRSKPKSLCHSEANLKSIILQKINKKPRWHTDTRAANTLQCESPRSVRMDHYKPVAAYSADHNERVTPTTTGRVGGGHYHHRRRMSSLI
ncbi:hypothetical protein MLD38_020668 [Melastoma candidum]|uniref:Uncharacterized protein n=1 Tax=Melastoma candidum TaxID=119954 RepID=A0ACB9QGM3_9MYRT|nr:hypothetical protein MLD38_020668 [Melastoma candidum]